MLINYKTNVPGGAVFPVWTRREFNVDIAIMVYLIG
jgi:hypothetical protein